MKPYLQEKLDAKKRKLSAVSESGGYILSAMENGNRVSSDVQNGPGVNLARYKTELCRSFSESGFCRYGDKCQFAHGISELRQTSRHPRYKTELCKAYHMNGFCPYGAR